ncbi:MAG: hypothetical protein HYT12_00320 [Candidatus Liptonbacteria bacterium]|nr:hypothetical protein [Candidatus Liptonbacteria bacterium]
MSFKKVFQNIVIIIISVVWVFNGYPQIRIRNWIFPPDVDMASAALGDTVTIVLTNTASTTWIVPSDWNNASNTIELIGGGSGGSPGAGSGGSSHQGGGGGGAGAYAKISNFATSAGNSVKIQVGGGGASDTNGVITFFNWNNSGSTSTCSGTTMSACASAGADGAHPAGGVGGASSTSVGTLRKSGGNGGAGQAVKNTNGGGGGGAAGLNGDGNVGQPSTGTSAGGSGDAGFGGSGGPAGTPPTSNGVNGTEWTTAGSGGGGGGSNANNTNGGAGGAYGAGGGGGRSSSGSGGAGAQGVIVIKYTPLIHAQSSYRFFQNVNATSVGSGLAGANASATLSAIGDQFRLRMLIHASGTNSNVGSSTFKLQFATSTAGGCDINFTGETYIDVETSSGDIRYYNNTSAPSPSLLTASSGDPTHEVGGVVVNQTYNESNNFTVTSTIQIGEDGQWDFSLVDFSAPAGQTYCFRAVHSSNTVLDDYLVVPEIKTASGNQAPVVSLVTLNGGSEIIVIENSSTSINLTATITDDNGFADIASATGTIYRSGVGAGCSADDNNCYPVSGCTLSGCSGNSCTATCSANIWYHADPTDAGPFSGQSWRGSITGTDAASATHVSSTASGVQLNTLSALQVTAVINYGSLDPGANTEATTQTAVVTNTGNSAIDIDLSGDDMTFGGNTISVGNQKYATSTFTYSSCTVCTALTTTDTAYELDLAKPTATSTSITDDIFWGLSVSNGSVSGLYTGTSTFTARAD